MAHDCLTSREERISGLSFFQDNVKFAFRVSIYTRVIKRNEDSLMNIKVTYQKTFQKETQPSPKY